MTKEHVIGDDVLDIAVSKFSNDHRWVAYNTACYFLEKEDVEFFKDEGLAKTFLKANENYRVLYSQSLDDLLRQIPYGKILDQQLKSSIMNEQNFEYLKDNLKYMGFGEKQHELLEQNLKEGKEAFQMTFKTEVNKKPFEAALQFRRSDNSDMYFFNSYKASLERTNGEKIDQTFYLNKGKGVTAKEAYNLLEGRSVFKELTNREGESYKAWIQLDLTSKDKNNNHEVKQYHENYGYDLKTAVAKFAVAELDGGEKEKALLQSLQKGNLQSVNINVSGEAQKIFIEANPQYKTINLYGDKMQMLNQQQRQGLLEKQSIKTAGNEVNQDQKQELKKENKKTLNDKVSDNLDGAKKKTTPKKRMSG